MGTQGTKIDLGRALALAKTVQEDLHFTLGVAAHVAGSMRRGLPEVNDIDFVVVTETGDLPEDMEKCLPDGKFTSKGKKKVTFITADDVQIDFNACKEEFLGSFMLHCTGSVATNVIMRKNAMKIGASLSQYGLKLKDGTVVAESEEAIYKTLGMEYALPENR